jgi:hypothetical protein
MNTWSYDGWVLRRVNFETLWTCHIDRRHQYEPNSIKIIALRGLEAEIINVHVFARPPSPVYYIMHIKRPGFPFHKS